MNVTHDMSVFSLVTGASVLVQLVMAGNDVEGLRYAFGFGPIRA